MMESVSPVWQKYDDHTVKIELGCFGSETTERSIEDEECERGMKR